jgi:DNA-directed RNA polymerase subunit M/transcription elongation factor TFIIS
MATLDSATEWRRLSELYRRMADGELLALARKQSELTDVAQGALANEMSFRKLKLEPEVPSAPPSPPREVDPVYDEDRRLVEILTVWSVADALQVQQLLDTAGIPFFMGSEKATGVNAVTSNFGDGVGVQIMNIGVPWARQALMNYEPANEPRPKQEEEEPEEILIRCPKCHSTEVVFEDLIGEESKEEKDSPQEFEWTCDACGHRWTDDGIVLRNLNH